MMVEGHALDLIEQITEAPDLIVTDPPYAFGGTGDERCAESIYAVLASLWEARSELAKLRSSIYRKA